MGVHYSYYTNMARDPEKLNCFERDAKFKGEKFNYWMDRVYYRTLELDIKYHYKKWKHSITMGRLNYIEFMIFV